MRFPTRLGAQPAKASGFALAWAALAASLLTPTALMASALALWRLAAELRWAQEFAIHRGPFSHWQVWLTLAVTLRLVSAWLLESCDDGD